jgi:hypothetical protein
MYDVQPSGPEIIRFQGIWAGLPGMHQHFGDKEESISFNSTENGLLRRVLWAHDPSKSEDYLFVAMNPASISEGYRIYDLVVDDSDNFARLYIIKTIGEAAINGDEEIENEWHEFQRESGLILPNLEDKGNFHRIFKDFCQVVDQHNYN